MTAAHHGFFTPYYLAGKTPAEGNARVAARAVAGSKAGKKRKSFFARLYDAIVASQTIRAERELALHRHLLPPDFEFTRGKRRSRREGQTPFGGW